MDKKTEDTTKENKVTLLEVLVRLLLIISPVILPQFFATEKMTKIIIPVIWFVIYGPFFVMPHLNYDQWEDNAKPFFWIFKSIFLIYMALLVGSGLMYVFFGKPHYS
jgi:hypothetical protein